MASSEIVPDEQLREAIKAFDCNPIPQLSYGTVEDYCNFADLFPGLASYNQDLKDIQRCWTLKSVLANCPRGSRLLEIGAGEPLIADIFGRMGYEVIAVDPYQGQGNGPTDIDHFKKVYPNLTYIVDEFSENLKSIQNKSIDCCYSISVLEHIPLVGIASVATAMRAFTRVGGLSIHSIDCVTAGPGTAYHKQMIDHIVGGILAIDFDSEKFLEGAALNPETYFLSAEAHNRWRGRAPYSEFAMRRCLSVQVCHKYVEGHHENGR